LACQPPAMPTIADGEATIWRCPRCQGPMRIVERLTASQFDPERTAHACALDSSPNLTVLLAASTRAYACSLQVCPRTAEDFSRPFVERFFTPTPLTMVRFSPARRDIRPYNARFHRLGFEQQHLKTHNPAAFRTPRQPLT
ncbi:MAG TPA: hypothetical protein VHZ55_17550, partial [Bryobacteraceae bacterium]|nr:hypothetical protein [Bryobacteraceae bacterium]